MIHTHPFPAFALAFLGFGAFASPPAPREIEADYPYLESLYHHLHRNPELSFQEEHTSARIADELRKAGFDVTDHIGGFGVVGMMRNGSGPTLLVRTDLDALPVEERTGLPYASTVHATEQDGHDVCVMHACGHDIHMTVFTGVARWMSNHKSDWSGTLMMIAQPAEERGAGAKAMLEDGLFERFARPDYNLALHVSSDHPAGTVAFVPGWSMANVDSVDITVHGVGGHGSAPHTTKDPIVIAASIIMDLQTIVSREIDPLKPAVVTVGSIHAGAKHNIISERADMQLTVRSYDDDVRNHLLESIKRITIENAKAFGVRDDKLPDVVVKDEFTPSHYNDPALTDRIRAAIEAKLGADRILPASPVMGGEDFSRYGRQDTPIPSLMFRLGAVKQDFYDSSKRRGVVLPSLHTPYFAPDPEPTITTGVEAMTTAAMEILGKK
ncbi:MAG: amidohydrolase [Phycisphaerales bacterium]